MQTETKPEEPTISDDETKKVNTKARLVSQRIAYKTVLAATVIGILTISSLWMFVVRPVDNPVNASALADPDVLRAEDNKDKGFESEGFRELYGLIDSKLVSLSGRIERGFESQQTHSSEVKRGLKLVTQSLQSIDEAITELGESSQELGRRINQATSRLDAIAKDVHALKTVRRKSTTKHKPRPVKLPPFHIDAIDRWDDVTYVAVSQAGQVAFLRPGEQQSGWTVPRIDRLLGQVDLKGPAGQSHSVSVQR